MLRFDANSSARLRPEAAQAVSDYVQHCAVQGANPSSIHQLGRRARGLLRGAREAVLASFFNTATVPPMLHFCSGGTEACNQLIHGLLGPRARRIVCSSIEHQAILEPLQQLEVDELRWCKPNEDGLIDVSVCCSLVTEDTDAVVLMAANNVTGAVQPVEAIAAILRESGYRGYIICDATQAAGKSELQLGDLLNAGVDAVALSGHKIGALPGIGAFVFSQGSERCALFRALITGGPQEQRFRAGTENGVGIVSFGAAAQALSAQGVEERMRVRACRERLWEQLAAGEHEIQRLTPDAESALCNTLAVRIPGIRGDDFVAGLDLSGVAASTGSACSSGRQEASHVFTEMGLDAQAGREAIRLSLDWDCQVEEVDLGAEKILALVSNMLRKGSSHKETQVTSHGTV